MTSAVASELRKIRFMEKGEENKIYSKGNQMQSNEKNKKKKTKRAPDDAPPGIRMLFVQYMTCTIFLNEYL